MAGEDGNQYVWGYVPIIVAKVGLFLKEKGEQDSSFAAQGHVELIHSLSLPPRTATEVEGVFRIAGSQKRMRDLQETFDTGPKYGKNVVWERYSVHDAASVLRRYLNQMPVSGDDRQAQVKGDFRSFCSCVTLLFTPSGADRATRSIQRVPQRDAQAATRRRGSDQDVQTPDPVDALGESVPAAVCLGSPRRFCAQERDQSHALQQ